MFYIRDGKRLRFPWQRRSSGSSACSAVIRTILRPRLDTMGNVQQSISNVCLVTQLEAAAAVPSWLCTSKGHSWLKVQSSTIIQYVLLYTDNKKYLLMPSITDGVKGVTVGISVFLHWATIQKSDLGFSLDNYVRNLSHGYILVIHIHAS